MEELNVAFTLNPLLISAVVASLQEKAKARAAAKAREEGRALAAQAAALLDKTTKAFDHPSAPLIRPWTVGERLPSTFFFKQLDQLVLYLLTIPSAYNTARTVGSFRLPFTQALALNVVLFFAICFLMCVSAGAALSFNLFRDVELWKRNALVAVCALTALAGGINFVSWLQEEGDIGGSGWVV